MEALVVAAVDQLTLTLAVFCSYLAKREGHVNLLISNFLWTNR